MWIGTALVLRLEEPSSMTKTYAVDYTLVAHMPGIVQIDCPEDHKRSEAPCQP
jgi:hypothetical protein